MSDLPRTWIHSTTEVQARRIEFLSLLIDQYRQARTQSPDCACCGKSFKWTELYRCYQCDIWLCKSCTRDHMPEVKR